MATGGLTPGEPGVLDTSVFIADEQDRGLRARPSTAAVSVVTLGELHLGVLMANSPEARARRLRTLGLAESQFEPLPIDAGVARVFAEIVATARRQRRRPGVNETWIAATAVANDLPVYTQDEGFDTIPLVRVFHV